MIQASMNEWKYEPEQGKYKMVVWEIVNDLRSLQFGLHLRIMKKKPYVELIYFRILNL